MLVTEVITLNFEIVVTLDPRDKNKKYNQNFGFTLVEKDSTEVTLVDRE